MIDLPLLVKSEVGMPDAANAVPNMAVMAMISWESMMTLCRC